MLAHFHRLQGDRARVVEEDCSERVQFGTASLLKESSVAAASLSHLSAFILRAAKQRCLLALHVLDARSSVLVGRLAALKVEFTLSVDV